jgi:hypothetical protein
VLKKTLIGLLALLFALALLVYAAGKGLFGDHEAPGEVTQKARPPGVVAREAQTVAAGAHAIGVSRPKQILFGDLHVHTTFSFDAFTFSLPFLGGEGAHPPADACDFARFCSALDFWSINDHAFSITPRHWQETVESVRQCNAVAGDGASPDTVAFLGWEWTQVGTAPENHYGHKNVVLAHTDDERIPARPIAALRGGALGASPNVMGLGVFALLAGGRVHDLATYFSERESARPCDSGVPVRELPVDCVEQAATPAELFAKLDDWGHDAIVIPHGTSWGFYTPPGSDWRKQLVGDMHDPQRQTLIEVYSGHGDSEVHRDWRAALIARDGSATCPEPRGDYLPSCWRAGEIILERCRAEGLAEDECEGRAAEARQHAVDARVAGHRTVQGESADDWLDAGQCRDCREPAFNYRPGGSAQFIHAIGNFDEDPESPRRFRMGFMASSDNHYARPGTGYKERHRVGMTESLGGTGAGRGEGGGPIADILQPPEEPASARSKPFDFDAPAFDVFETERQASFLTTGGLIAAHSEGRDRDAIWDALQRREVYGTSGPRMLLWFDLLNPPGSRGQTLPMGGAVSLDRAPVFQVRAVGSYEQREGCPSYAHESLSPERLAHLCKGECHHPSDRRRNITRIEIVRIQPQQRPDEPLSGRIQDPWRSFACDADPAGCSVTFTDPDFRRDGRDTLYYARAFEAPKPTINAGNLRCDRDDQGRCVAVNACPEGGREDDCLAPGAPRAWSSPIFVDVPAPNLASRE